MVSLEQYNVAPDPQIEKTKQKGDEIDKNSSSLSFEDFKRSLGVGANKYTDEQIERIRSVFDKIADATFDKWLLQRNVGTMGLRTNQE